MIRFHSAVTHLLVPIERVHPHPDNANNGDVDEIVVSIVRNGCYRPIYADSEGTILAGHHLYAALLELGATQVPVMFLDTEPGEDEGVRILLGDNRIARKAKMDSGLELKLLQTLDDYTGSGYTEKEVVAFLAKMDAQERLTFPEEPLPSLPTCPNCGEVLP